MRFLKATLLILVSITCNFHALAWPSATLSSPSNGAMIWVGAELDWNSVSGTQFYELQVDTTTTFNSSALRVVTKAYINSFGGNSDTEHAFNDLYFGKKYYWRVRAYITGDTSAWIQREFTTEDLVNLSTPLDSTDQWTGVTFDWLPHIGVDFYDIEVDTNQSFTSPVRQRASKAYINSFAGNSDTEHRFSDLYFGKQYYWRVRARNAADSSSWGVARRVITRDNVTLSTPLDSTDQWTGVTFDWLSHHGVNFYDIEVDTNSSFTSAARQRASKTYINSFSGGTDTRHAFTNLYFGKQYYWRVRARNTVDSSSWGVARRVFTRDGVTLTSPADGLLNANTNGLTLDWNSHLRVDAYEVQLDTINTFSSPALVSVNKNYLTSISSNSDTRHSTGALLVNQTYHWRVRAINSADSSSWSTRVFSTGSIITGIAGVYKANDDLLLIHNYLSGNLELRTEESQQKTTVELYTIGGTLVHQQVDYKTHQFFISVANYRSGIYLVRMVSNGKVRVGKFVKE